MKKEVFSKNQKDIDDFNAICKFLIKAEKDEYAEYNERIASVENMCGGRYLLSSLVHDEYGVHEEIEKLVDNEGVAAAFLVYGII